MLRALLCLLIVCVPRPVFAGHPERFLDWEQFPAPPSEWGPLTLAGAKGVLYAGMRDTGVHRFDDEAGTWETYGLPGRRVWKLAADGGTLYAYCNDRQGGLYRAAAGGEWREVPASPKQMRFVGVSQGSAYVGVDGLQALDLATGTLTPISLRVVGLDIRRVDYRRTPYKYSISVATEAGKGFSRAADASTWSSQFRGPPGAELRGNLLSKEINVAATDIGFYFEGEGDPGWWPNNEGLPSRDIVSVVGVQGADGTLCVGVRGEGVYAGSAEGSWSPWNNGLPSLDVLALAASPEGAASRRVYVVVAGHGVYTRLEGAEMWEALDPGANDPAVTCVAPGDGQAYVGRRDGEVTLWIAGDPPTSAALPSRVPGWDLRALEVAPEGLYAATQVGLFLTRDEGASWEPVDIQTESASAMAVDGRTRYVMTGEGMLLRSVDGGDWRYLAPELQFDGTRDIAVVDGSVYVAGSHGMFGLPSGADDWTRLSPGGTPDDGIGAPGKDVPPSPHRPEWTFRAIAIIEDDIYGASGAGIVRARLP